MKLSMWEGRVGETTQPVSFLSLKACSPLSYMFHTSKLFPLSVDPVLRGYCSQANRTYRDYYHLQNGRKT